MSSTARTAALSQPQSSRAAQSPRDGREGRARVGRPAAQSARPDSRGRLLAAAGHEFAERGFAGASVDRIARRARLNKAMIYYHFTSKAGLYREVLREMYRAVGTRVRALAEAPLAPHDALAAFVSTVVQEASDRPYFPRVMMRELADRARHLDAETIALAVVIPESLGAIIARGVAAGQFEPLHPVLAYVTVMGSVLAFFGSAPIRARVTSGPMRGATDLDVSMLVAHCQRTLRSLVARQPAVRSTSSAETAR
jgi:AcrR family transcriptional regulator